jgi:hypothetical protein
MEERDTFNKCAIGVRFNPVQRGIIWAGLHRIVLAYTTFRETGSADGYPFRIHPLSSIPRPGLSPGTFNSAFMEMITDLWARIKPARGKRIRLQLNFVQLSVCILAVRIRKDYERLRLKRKISIEQKRAIRESSLHWSENSNAPAGRMRLKWERMPISRCGRRGSSTCAGSACSSSIFARGGSRRSSGGSTK